MSLRAPADEPLSVLLHLRDENETVVPVPWLRKEGLYARYEAALPACRGRCDYYFEIRSGEERKYYGRDGLGDRADSVIPFAVLPDFHVPVWARGAVYYQIFPDRFRNGDASNDVLTGELLYIQGIYSEQVNWNSAVQPLDVFRFYGGDLEGIRQKLGYLSELGVDVLYLNPIFVSPSNHKYDAQDYFHVDPHLGAISKDEGAYFREEGAAQQGSAVRPPEKEEDGEPVVSQRYICRTAEEENLQASDRLLARLIAEAETYGIRVVLDGVFNHCGSFHAWMDRSSIYRERGGRGAWWNPASPCRQYFNFTGPEEYEGWWKHSTLPKLEVEHSEALRHQLFEVGKKWVRPPFGASGWRLDVAADVGHTEAGNHAFWQAFRREVRSADPEALLLAEHYGDPSPWLQGDEWDGVMNYDAFLDPISYFFTGMEKHSDRYEPEADGSGTLFFETLRKNMGRLPRASLECSLNELDNHDHSRFLTRTGRQTGRLKDRGSEAAQEGISKALLRAAVLVQMTLPGAPGIYYGDEAGLCGFTDPDSRRPYPWGHQDFALLDFYTAAVRLHKRWRGFTAGSLVPLAAGRGYIAYGMILDGEAALTVIHQGTDTVCLSLDLTLLTGFAPCAVRRLLETDENGYNCGALDIPVTAGRLELQLGPHRGTVYELIYQGQKTGGLL